MFLDTPETTRERAIHDSTGEGGLMAVDLCLPGFSRWGAPCGVRERQA